MALHPRDLMEPEETVGNLWHGVALRLAPVAGHAASAVTLEAVRPSVAPLFRALGGTAGVDIAASPATASRHRRSFGARLADARVLEHVARFDGETLRLPPVIDAFPSVEMNRVAYLWLAALAACATPAAPPADPRIANLAHIAAMGRATAAALSLCPGLRAPHAALCAHLRRTGPPWLRRRQSGTWPLARCPFCRARRIPLGIRSIRPPRAAMPPFGPFRSGCGSILPTRVRAPALPRMPSARLRALPVPRASRAAGRTTIRPTAPTASSCTGSNPSCPGWKAWV